MVFVVDLWWTNFLSWTLTITNWWAYYLEGSALKLGITETVDRTHIVLSCVTSSRLLRKQFHKKSLFTLTTACQLSGGPTISTCGPYKQEIVILTSCRCGVILWSPVKQCPDLNPIFSSNCSHRKMIVLKSPSAFEQIISASALYSSNGHDR